MPWNQVRKSAILFTFLSRLSKGGQGCIFYCTRNRKHCSFIFAPFFPTDLHAVTLHILKLRWWLPHTIFYKLKVLFKEQLFQTWAHKEITTGSWISTSWQGWCICTFSFSCQCTQSWDGCVSQWNREKFPCIYHGERASSRAAHRHWSWSSTRSWG